MSKIIKDQVINRFKALVVSNEKILGARGYRLYYYDLDTKFIKYYSKVIDKKNAFLSRIPLIRRLFRAEITKLYTLKNGDQILIAKKAFYKKRTEDKDFIKCYDIPRGSRPLNLCIDRDDNIYFGEYFSNPQHSSVHIYHSNDGGENWQIAYSFSEDTINHIHGVFYDPYTNYKWVLTGDLDNECIIGYTEDNFNKFKVIYRGKQEFRSCHLFFFKDYIIYGTDSQYIENKIIKFNRDTLKIEVVYHIPGSCIYAVQCNDICLLSSTVEPSKINKDNNSYLFLSDKLGGEWKEIAKHKKDIWPATVFQFGSIQFPRYESCDPQNFIVYTGRALKGIAGKTIILSK